MSFMQIILAGTGDYLLRAQGAAMNCRHGSDAYPGL